MKKVDINKGQALYEGKAKIVYATDNPSLVIQHFKDSATAFNAAKVGTILGKGEANAMISRHLFEMLESKGIPTQYVDFLPPTDLVTRKLDMLPVEVVVRNVAAGSLSKRLGYPEGTPLKNTLIEFYLKDDDLGDPLLTVDHIHELELITDAQIDSLKELGLRINNVLLEFFLECGLNLIDYKLEFGVVDGKIYLGDEISPDTCRLWDVGTGKKLDKDRFRHDLGGVEEAYREVLKRIESK